LPPPPQLSQYDTLYLDTETTGVNWAKGDRPVGIAVGTPDGKRCHLPFGHKAGGNLDVVGFVSDLEDVDPALLREGHDHERAALGGQRQLPQGRGLECLQERQVALELDPEVCAPS